MNRLRFLSCLWVVIVMLGIAGCGGNKADDSDGIRASGFIEGQVFAVASSQGGRVDEVLVAQGDDVALGELLVTLDSTYLESLRDQAQAGVNAAQAALDAFQEKPTTKDVDEADAALKSAEAKLDTAKAARDLLLASYEPSEPPAIELNPAESAIDVAEAAVTLAEAQLAQVKAGPMAEERRILEAQLQEAQANLQAVERQLDELKLTAIVEGTVLQVMNQESEIVSAGSTVVYLMDPENLRLRLFIPVTQVAKIKVGDSFEITGDAYPDENFSATVLHIADEAQFTPATVLTQEERVKLVFEIELLIDDPSGKLKPGMPVDAWRQD
jgi:HlyD family secretion protein